MILIEQGDLGGNATGVDLIEAGFSDIARGAILSCRRAVAERDTWLCIAPHLVMPLQIAMPSHPHHRSPLGIRTVLALHDRLSRKSDLPSSATLDVSHHPVGVPLQRPYGVAFAWSESLADTARVVTLSAVDAAERGAAIMTGARCVRADRTGGIWKLAVVNRGSRISLTACALVNATGAWIPAVAETVLRLPVPPLRLISRSTLVVRNPYDHDGAYALQDEGGFVYAMPLQQGFAMIGTIEANFVGDPAIATPLAADIERLCRVVNHYFREPISPTDVVHAAASAHAVPLRGDQRAGIAQLDGRRGEAPLITVFGGDVTMSRKRAERAVDRLIPFYPMSPRWTATQPLPGGDLPIGTGDDHTDDLRSRYWFLDGDLVRRLVVAYGTRADRVLGQASSRDDLAPWFGDDLSAAEVRYLMTVERARFPDDILWRRTRLGLTIGGLAREALAAFMAAL